MNETSMHRCSLTVVVFVWFILVPFASATERAIALVPFANCSFSNTPIGPFQKMVRAFLISSLYAAMVFGPMSNAFCSSDKPPATSTVSIFFG